MHRTYIYLTETEKRNVLEIAQKNNLGQDFKQMDIKSLFDSKAFQEYISKTPLNQEIWWEKLLSEQDGEHVYDVYCKNDKTILKKTLAYYHRIDENDESICPDFLLKELLNAL
jgi:hypothetical protein